MKQWIENKIIKRGESKYLKGSIWTLRAGASIKNIIVHYSRWVKVQNDRYMQVSVLERISKDFPEPPNGGIIWLWDALILSGRKYGYTFRTYPRNRITTTKERGKDGKK